MLAISTSLCSQLVFRCLQVAKIVCLKFNQNPELSLTLRFMLFKQSFSDSRYIIKDVLFMLIKNVMQVLLHLLQIISTWTWFLGHMVAWRVIGRCIVHPYCYAEMLKVRWKCLVLSSLLEGTLMEVVEGITHLLSPSMFSNQTFGVKPLTFW